MPLDPHKNADGEKIACGKRDFLLGTLSGLKAGSYLIHARSTRLPPFLAHPKRREDSSDPQSLCNGSQRSVGGTRAGLATLRLNLYPHLANTMATETEHPDDSRSVGHPADQFRVSSDGQPPRAQARRPSCRMSQKCLRQPSVVRQMVFLQ